MYTCIYFHVHDKKMYTLLIYIPILDVHVTQVIVKKKN